MLVCRLLSNASQKTLPAQSLTILTSGAFAAIVGLAVMEPTPTGEPANPFATPLEILPEWYFFPTFNLLRVIPNKLLGVMSMAAVPLGLITVPFVESVNKFQNPFRRPLATSVFLVGTGVPQKFQLFCRCHVECKVQRSSAGVQVQVATVPSLHADSRSVFAIWMGIGATMPIDEAISLGLW